MRDYFVFVLNRTIAMEYAKRRETYAVNRYGYVIWKKIRNLIFIIDRFDAFMSNINAVIGKHRFGYFFFVVESTKTNKL